MSTDTKITPADLQSALDQFSGSEEFYAHWMKIRFTEGIKFLADKAEAHWLIDLIASWQIKPKVRREEFQVWILKVNRHPPKGKPMAYARCYSDTPEPDNANQVCVQGIPYTDFPLDEIKLWCVNGTLMLPGEY
ncbi:MAG: DUF6876 family protein [Thermoguttaceae bacterium]|jgi:hypothetical protein